MGTLRAIGITEDSEQLYRFLLRETSAQLVSLAADLSWSDARVSTALQPLLDADLVRETADGVVIRPVRSALKGVIKREQQQLEQRRQELDDLGPLIQSFIAEQAKPSDAGLDPVGLELVSAQDAGATLAELVRMSHGPIRSVQLRLRSGPVADHGMTERGFVALSSARELLTVYPAEILRDATQAEWVRQWSEIGEQQRVGTAVPAEFFLLGTEAVFLGQKWGDPYSSAIVTRVPALIAGFSALFEGIWGSSSPGPGATAEQNIDTRLLALLANGFKDEVIARYLGVGVRTVRRRIAGLMLDLNVQTRFQLGVSADRSGLLQRGSGSRKSS